MSPCDGLRKQFLTPYHFSIVKEMAMVVYLEIDILKYDIRSLFIENKGYVKTISFGFLKIVKKNFHAIYKAVFSFEK